MAKKSERDGEGKSNDSPTEPHFNLLYAPWIPVLWRDGRAERVGIKAALTKAGKIRQIAATNPMDNVALLRFLLAVLLWCKPDAKEALGKLLAADANAPSIPEAWLRNLDRHQSAFELLGPGERFYQDASLKEKKKQRPIGDLVSEFPTETKVNHLKHTLDKLYGLCPACCALGIVRHSSFANYLGSGYTSGINGGAPTYVTLDGDSLTAAIAANLPPQSVKGVDPAWLSSARPQSVSPISAFAWRPRKMWLGKLEPKKAVCALCGEVRELISQHSFAGGWSPPAAAQAGGKKFWGGDPHLLLVQSNASEPEDDEEQGVTILSFPSPERPVDRHARHWRRVASALVTTRCVVSVVGGVTTQSGLLYQDSASLKVPSQAAPPPDIQAEVLQSVKKSLDNLETSERAQERRHPEMQSALVLLTPEAERQVRAALSNPVETLQTSAATDSPEDKANADKKFLRDIYQPVVEQVVDATAKGSPLRRRAAKQLAQALLNKKMREVVDEAGKPADESGEVEAKPAKPSKPKRSRKKKERA